ncbi:Hypothetical protein NTJ_00425 [Nesidiocoris tenuis]|uniref:Uncharacterized protein n=1 Tax=Nesidiocoris tenuis TaxID=355587 RepID=A0ABN7A8M5_9HEMI|nr:Hypothetical protein NTJ_00425 [Nesidiocoris tenuis]
MGIGRALSIGFVLNSKGPHEKSPTYTGDWVRDLGRITRRRRGSYPMRGEREETEEEASGRLKTSHFAEMKNAFYSNPLSIVGLDDVTW